jgi:hypothetical protein
MRGREVSVPDEKACGVWSWAGRGEESSELLTLSRSGSSKVSFRSGKFLLFKLPHQQWNAYIVACPTRNGVSGSSDSYSAPRMGPTRAFNTVASTLPVQKTPRRNPLPRSNSITTATIRTSLNHPLQSAPPNSFLNPRLSHARTQAAMSAIEESASRPLPTSPDSIKTPGPWHSRPQCESAT